MTTKTKTFHEKVSEIIKTLNAPKSAYNAHGKFNYRNVEDIMEGVKPILNGLVLTVSDEIEFIGDRFYVRSVATITDGEKSIKATGWAREPNKIKLPCDEPQVTGACTSYARKVALGGLLCIDDNKDSDSTGNPALNNSVKPKQPIKQTKPTAKQLAHKQVVEFVGKILKAGNDRDGLLKALAITDSKELNDFSEKELLEAYKVLKSAYEV